MLGIMPSSTRSPIQAVIERFAPRLRFPHLFLLLLVLFVADLFLVDPIPFVDELMLGLLTFLLGSWRTRREVPADAVRVNGSGPAETKSPPETGE